MTAYWLGQDGLYSFDGDKPKLVDPLPIDWAAVANATGAIFIPAPTADPHYEDHLAGFVPLTNPTKWPEPAPKPFPIWAMNSPWHWRHGA